MQKLQLELDFVTSGLKTLHRVDLWPGWDREWGRCPPALPDTPTQPLSM